MSIMDEFREDEIIEIVDNHGMTMTKTSIVSTSIPDSLDVLSNITPIEAVSEASNEIN